MTTTTLPARLTHPRQAPPAGAEHPCPQTTALDPAGLARQPGNQSGAEPQNPNNPGHHCPPDTRARTRTSTSHHDRLDIPRPFMDDTGRPRCRPRVTQLCVWCVPDCRGHRVPRAPLPGAGVTRAGAASRPPGGALPPRRCSYGLMRQTIPLPAPRLAPCAPGLCRLSPVPAARWPFPTLSPRSLRRCSDPYPAALLGCACPLLHRGHRSHPTLDGFDARIYPHTATSVGSPISRLQSFDYLRAPTLARPPRLLPPQQRKRCRAAGPFTPRIARPVTRTGMWRCYMLDTDN